MAVVLELQLLVPGPPLLKRAGRRGHLLRHGEFGLNHGGCLLLLVVSHMASAR